MTDRQYHLPLSIQRVLGICISIHSTAILKKYLLDFLGGPVIKNPCANAGDIGSIPGPGRFHMPWGS